MSKKYTPLYVFSSIPKSSLSSFLLVELSALQFSVSLHSYRSRSSAIPAQTEICWGCWLHSLQPFTGWHMGHVHQSQQHHSRTFFINRFISDAGPRSQHFPGLLWHCRLNKHCASAAKQVPSFMFSCLWNSLISSHSTLSGRSRWQMCSAYNIVFMISCLLAEQWKKHLEARICSIFSALGNWAKKIA